LFASRARTRALLSAAVVVLVGLDLTSAGLRLHPTVDKRAFGPLELNMSSRPRLGESRALVSRQAETFLNRVGMTNPAAYCVTIRGALFHNNNLLENIPKVDGFCSLRLRETSKLMPALNDTNLLTSPLAAFRGVACMTAPDNVFAWHTRSGSLPLITAGQRPVFSNDQQSLQAVTSGDFKPRKVVLCAHVSAGVCERCCRPRGQHPFPPMECVARSIRRQDSRADDGADRTVVLSQLARVGGWAAGPTVAGELRISGAGDSHRAA
jgi:hypothetical protein